MRLLTGKKDSKTAAAYAVYPSMGDNSQGLGTWYTLYSPQAGSSTDWRVSSPGASVDLNMVSLCSRHWVYSQSFLQLVLSEITLISLYYLFLGGRDLVNLIDFRDFLKLFYLLS